MDASQLPKGQSRELNKDGPNNEPGIYKHKDTKELFITADGEAGSIQADALMSPVWKDAWEWVGEVPNRLELLKIRKEQAIKDAKEEAMAKKSEEEEIADAVAAVTKKPEKSDAPGTGSTYEPSKAK